MRYDYIIAGAGGAGLSLLSYLNEQPSLSTKKILILDKQVKRTNDRTWCFWQKETSPFESIVHRKWESLYFHTPEFSELLNISPYQYKMIRAIDFYDHCYQIIHDNQNIELVHDEIQTIDSNVVTGLNGTYEGDYVFNSAQYKIDPSPSTHHLLQHFKGWFLKTSKSVFNTSEPILMDFRITQVDGCSFVYVMPLSENEALVEYTLFSEKVLEQETYNKYIRSYLKEFWNDLDFDIQEEEFGIIPMTNAKLPIRSGNQINIGTAGGYSKPSTGYTFSFIQKYCRHIASNLGEGKDPLSGFNKSKNKYHYYDSIFLRVLAEQKIPAWSVFNDLFKKLPAELVLRFLDEDTNFLEELRLMNSVSKRTFIPAALKELTIVS